MTRRPAQSNIFVMTRPQLYLLFGLIAALILLVLVRMAARRSTRRELMRLRPRVDRYKLTQKRQIITDLLADEEIAGAVRAHADEHALPEAAVWGKVRTYLDEIIPTFSLFLYYRFGYGLSRLLLNVFYKVTVMTERPDPLAGIPRNATVIYLMNHRSNADYVLVAYALAGDVSISYAVGEWARAFPLEYLFKSFGSYFIRRKYREPLYHAVLSRYVQLITRHGVTQGIFPEGGLTRDGLLQRPKVGLLDYALSAARDPEVCQRLYFVPVAINYDRVLEDRSLLQESATRGGATRPSRLAQLHEVTSYVVANFTRMLVRRWKRYGRAALTIGNPVPLTEWLARHGHTMDAVLALPKEQRLGVVQSLVDDVMGRVGTLMPVTAVPLACAALQTFPADYVPRSALLARMSELREVLGAFNGQDVLQERDIDQVFDRAYRMLRMRRVVARQGDAYVILPRGRAIVTFYANSIAHLLGPFSTAVRDRDRILAATGLEGAG